MPKQVIKILLVQTTNMNLGDTVIGDNNDYLIKKALSPKKCDILRYNIALRDVSQIKYVDAVIFAGGIIKSTTEKFWLYILEILQEADKYNVPVFMSGIGVEDFHPDDERSINLKTAINLPCVKGMSIRDDIETLKKDYLTNDNISIYPVYDVAVWSKNTYKRYLKIRKKKHELVGLGITREKLFADYGNPQIDRQVQLDLWKGIIERLDQQGIKWVLFTNGDPNDELFAKDVLEHVGHGEKLDAPLDGVSLVQNISAFSSVIAGRMHSNIISYALNIPSIGFVWNQKLKFWGERIGYPERFIPCDKLNADNVFTAWQNAVAEGCKLNKEFKYPIYNALKEFTKKWCHKREKEHENMDFSKTMLAPSLGGIQTRYKNTNSKEAFYYSLGHSYKNFHADIRLTSDNVAVCVNRWHKSTYKLLNHPMQYEENIKSIPFDEFINSKYYHRFSPMSLDELMCISQTYLNKHKINLVLSFGHPSTSKLKKILSELKECIKKYQIKTDNIYIRLEQEKDIEYYKNSKMKPQIIYHVVDKKQSYEDTLKTLQDALTYCNEQGIGILFMNHCEYTQEFAQLCAKHNVSYYTDSCEKTETIITNIKNGAHFVGSHFYDVDYLSRLTK